jgi:hypothetical protein
MIRRHNRQGSGQDALGAILGAYPFRVPYWASIVPRGAESRLLESTYLG